MSAFVRTTDSSQTSHHVRKVPTAEVVDSFDHLVGLAQAEMPGTVNLSALSALRLTTSSNLVACWTGRSSGRPPSVQPANRRTSEVRQAWLKFLHRAIFKTCLR
jgi:hypothetical protein